MVLRPRVLAKRGVARPKPVAQIHLPLGADQALVSKYEQPVPGCSTGTPPTISWPAGGRACRSCNRLASPGHVDLDRLHHVEWHVLLQVYAVYLSAKHPRQRLQPVRPTGGHCSSAVGGAQDLRRMTRLVHNACTRPCLDEAPTWPAPPIATARHLNWRRPLDAPPGLPGRLVELRLHPCVHPPATRSRARTLQFAIGAISSRSQSWRFGGSSLRFRARTGMRGSSR